jgi:urease accessory protein
LADLRGVATAKSEIFAANRARGSVALGAEVRDGVSRCVRRHESGCLRARFPNSDAGALEAVILNTAGGIAGGDQLALDIEAGHGARITVTTAAAEKVYRSLGPDACVDVRLSIDPGAALRWLPQEMILFDGARIRRSITIDLAEDATVILAEAVVFGRSAMGERLAGGAFFDRWRVRRGGKLVYAETVRLDGMIGEKLAQTAVAAGAAAIATVLLTPADDSAVAAVRALSQDFAGEVGISSWNGVTVIRFCARDGGELRRDLTLVLAKCGGGPLPRLWVN